MHLKTSWKKLLSVLGLFALGMVLLALLELFGGTPDPVQAPVPDDCMWVARMDVNTFWKKEMYAVLFQTKDENVMQEFKRLVNDKYIEKESKPIAMDIRRDVVAYQTMVNSHLVTVFVVQLTDPETFEENMKSVFGKSSLIRIEGKTAMVVSLATRSQKATKSELNAIADKLSKAPKLNVADIGKKDQLIAVQSGKGERRSFSYGLSCEDQSLNIDGTINFLSTRFEPMSHTVKQKGFSLYCANVPVELSNGLMNRFPFLGRPNPYINYHITGISLDYEGVVISDPIKGIPDVFGVLPLPKFNAIVRCDRPIVLDSILRHFPPEQTNIAGEIRLNDVTYFVRMINKNTFFFGTDPSSIERTQRKEVLAMNGNLKSLTSFDGSMFTTAFISNIKEVKAINGLFDATGKMEFSVIPLKGKTHVVKGRLPFKEGKNTFTELTRLLLSLSAIK